MCHWGERFSTFGHRSLARSWASCGTASRVARELVDHRRGPPCVAWGWTIGSASKPPVFCAAAARPRRASRPSVQARQPEGVARRRRRRRRRARTRPAARARPGAGRAGRARAAPPRARRRCTASTSPSRTPSGARPLRRHPHAGRPGDARERVGQLAQPGHVRAAAVAQRRLRRRARLRARRPRAPGRPASGGAQRRPRRAAGLAAAGGQRGANGRGDRGGREALRHGARPQRLEVRDRRRRLPPGVLQVEPVVGDRGSGPAQEALDRMARAEDRPDHGLRQRQDAGARHRVAPALEAVVRGRDHVTGGGGRRGPVRDRHGQRQRGESAPRAPRRPEAGPPDRGPGRRARRPRPLAAPRPARRGRGRGRAGPATAARGRGSRPRCRAARLREGDRELLREVVGAAHDQARARGPRRAPQPGAPSARRGPPRAASAAARPRSRAPTAPPAASATWRSSQSATSRRSAVVAMTRSSAAAPVSESEPSSWTWRKAAAGFRRAPARRRRRCAPPDRGRCRAGPRPATTSRSACSISSAGASGAPVEALVGLEQRGRRLGVGVVLDERAVARGEEGPDRARGPSGW